MDPMRQTDQGLSTSLELWSIVSHQRLLALTGPTTPPGKRVQTLNPPGSETGPGGVATWGRATASKADAFGMKFEWVGRSSKHIPFDWSGPDEA